MSVFIFEWNFVHLLFWFVYYHSNRKTHTQKENTWKFILYISVLYICKAGFSQLWLLSHEVPPVHVKVKDLRRIKLECSDLYESAKKNKNYLPKWGQKKVCSDHTEALLTKYTFSLDSGSLSQGSGSPDWTPLRGRLLWSGGEHVFW